MEIDGNRKEQLRGKEVVPVSLNPYTIIIDKNQERVERGREEKEGGLFFQSTCHGKRRGIERSDTQENMSAQLLVGYHDLVALNALRHP
jgi:hypothetical protein